MCDTVLNTKPCCRTVQTTEVIALANWEATAAKIRRKLQTWMDSGRVSLMWTPFFRNMYYVFYSFHCVWYGKIIFYYISSYYWTLWWLTNYNKKMNVVVWHHLLVQCGPYMCARRSTLRGSGSFGKYVHKYRKTRSVVCSYISCVTASDSNTQQKYRRDVGCWSPISTRMVWEGLHRLVRRAKML